MIARSKLYKIAVILLFFLFLSFPVLAQSDLAFIEGEPYPGNSYIGIWEIAENLGHFGGKVAFSSSTGSSISFEFEGDYVEVYFRTFIDGGNCRIFIDGNDYGVVSTYEPGGGSFRKMLFFSYLERKNHTLSVVVDGSKQSESYGYLCRIDRLQYRPSYSARLDFSLNEFTSLYNLPPLYRNIFLGFITLAFLIGKMYVPGILYILSYDYLLSMQIDYDLALSTLYFASFALLKLWKNSVGRI